MTFPLKIVGLLKRKVDINFKFTINTALGVGNSFQLPLIVSETYNFTVYWGDGNSDVITVYNQAETLHTYSSGGVYQIIIEGKCGGFAFQNSGDKLKVVSADQFGDIGLDYVEGMWRGCTNMTSINVAGWDCSNITSLNYFIGACTGLTTFDGNSMDVSNVTEFFNFAESCSNLTSLNIGDWDTSSGDNFTFFAAYCSSLTTIPISNWDMSSATDISFFAAFCSGLTGFDVSSWNIGNVSNASLFVRNCSNLVTLNTDSWDTTSMTNCQSMCQNCGSLTSSFDANVWWNNLGITNHLNTFAGSTNISNYASIPNDWKGL